MDKADFEEKEREGVRKTGKERDRERMRERRGRENKKLESERVYEKDINLTKRVRSREKWENRKTKQKISM